MHRERGALAHQLIWFLLMVLCVELLLRLERDMARSHALPVPIQVLITRASQTRGQFCENWPTNWDRAS